MSAPPYKFPKDRTNPLVYAPIALVAIGLVVFVFASGVMQGLQKGKHATPRPPVREVQRPAVNVQALAQSTPELLANGQMLYNIACASCHGVQGYGDGAQGASLNPKPRNFHDTVDWKNGMTIDMLWKTLEEGIRGGSMASYSLMPREERIAIIHYVRELMEDPPEITSEQIAALPGPGEGAVASGPSEAPPYTDPRLPMELAMAKLDVVERAAPMPGPAPAALANHPGARDWNTYCISCHGANGGGRSVGAVVQTFPALRVATPPLPEVADWMSDESDAFSRLITSSGPGNRLHGFATLSREQLANLQDYATRLARPAGEN